MGSFLLCILQYVIIMILLAAIGLAGGLIGVKLRKNKNAKEASKAAPDEQ